MTARAGRERVNALCRGRPALPCTRLAKGGPAQCDTRSWMAKEICRATPLRMSYGRLLKDKKKGGAGLG
uniref:Uncharacterized protein n=1 Tax=Oryza brachyantha TaxID=4533 RepID=J3MYF3_ORYBR